MAPTNSRLAAGVGVVALFLLLGGPGATVAVADPGGSRGSDRGHSSDHGGGEHRGGGNGGDRNGAAGRGGDAPASAGRSAADNPATGRSGGSPQTRVGSGREDTARLSPGAADTDSGATSRRGSDPESSRGSDAAGATPSFEAPRVTIGNGRVPTVGGGDPQPRPQVPAPPPPAGPPPAPPPPPPPAPVPSLVDRIAAPPVVVRQFVVAPAAALTEPLWAIAGLLFIPAAGAALGYRQARAAQSVERLHRP